ncbi:hypothetical protein Ancab_025665 [Ancistrocladus abbreviatus]
MEQRLNQVWIGSYKLIANVARFARSKLEGGRAKRTVKEPLQSARGCSWQGNNRTYANAVCSKQLCVEERMRPMKPNSMDRKDDASLRGEEDSLWLKGSYIGVINRGQEGANFQFRRRGGQETTGRRRQKGLSMVHILTSSEHVRCLFRKNYLLRCYGVPFQVCTKNFLEKIAREWAKYISIDSRMKNRSRLLFARILVHTTKLERIDERMNIRVDGALFQIKVSEEVVSSEDMLYSEETDLDGCKKGYPIISLVVPSSPSHVDESIFNDQKESPTKSFPSMDGGITTKQRVTPRMQREHIRCSEKAEGDRP